MDALVRDSGNYYPSTASKISMAEDIIDCFPCLATNRPNVPRCSALVALRSGGKGFIDARLQTLRNKLSVEQKKRRSSKRSVPAAKKKTNEYNGDSDVLIPSTFDEATTKSIEDKVSFKLLMLSPPSDF